MTEFCLLTIDAVAFRAASSFCDKYDTRRAREMHEFMLREDVRKAAGIIGGRRGRGVRYPLDDAERALSASAIADGMSLAAVAGCMGISDADWFEREMKRGAV